MGQIPLDNTLNASMELQIGNIQEMFSELYGITEELTPGSFTPITASGAINPHASGSYAITKAGVAVLTLAAPTSGVDDGVTINLSSTTAYAHTLTATGLLQTGSASVNLATFAAYAGARLTLTAYKGKWYVQNPIGITFT